MHAVAAKLPRSCPTLRDPTGGSPPGSLPCILQARTLEWVLFPAPQLSLRHACVVVLSCFSRVRLFATPWTAARQAPLSVGFSKQEHWSGLPCPPPGDLQDPGIEPMSLSSPALAGGFFTTKRHLGSTFNRSDNNNISHSGTNSINTKGIQLRVHLPPFPASQSPRGHHSSLVAPSIHCSCLQAFTDLSPPRHSPPL